MAKNQALKILGVTLLATGLAFLFTWLNDSRILFLIIPAGLIGIFLLFIKYRNYQRFEKIIEIGFIRSAGIAVLFILFLIIFFLFKESLPFIGEYSLADFLFTSNWLPSENSFGAFAFIIGSFLVTMVAACIAIPLSLSTALFISEIAPVGLRDGLKIFIEILATIPTVIFGFIGILFLGPFLENALGLTTGLNAFTAGILLGLMAVPTITSIAEESLQAVANDLRQASMALGASRLQTMLKVTLPAGVSGIFAGTLLGLGRVIGETMTVLMVAGNGRSLTFNVFDPVRTITATIGAEHGSLLSGSIHYHSLFMLGLLLFIITLAINSLGTLVVSRIRKRQGLI